MPRIIIHRGAHTIGGNCVELQSKGYRILMDMGMPLMKKGGGELDEDDLKSPCVKNEILPNIKGLYKADNPSILAIFISHSHIDHCGLLNYVHPAIPVYCSPGTYSLIKTGQVFYPSPSKNFFNNFKVFEHWKPIQQGPFKITSYLMDHSGFDASAFLVEVDHKKVFYSGDFRGHGRKSKVLQIFFKKSISNTDCLLLEGTTLGGKHHIGFKNENEVEDALFNVFSKQKDTSFIAAAGSNVDRIVSLYKASRKSSKILVLDLYAYYLLNQLKKITPSLPPFDGDNIRIYYIRGHAQNLADHLGKRLLYEFKPRKIEINEICENRHNMVLKLPVSAMTKISKVLIKEKSFLNAKFIFSMWSGYLKKDSAFQNFCDEFHADLIQIHVSGHAYLSDLKKLACALNAKKVIPIHTLNRNTYSKHFKNVTRIEDGVAFKI